MNVVRVLPGMLLALGLLSPVAAFAQRSSIVSMTVNVDVANGLSLFIENSLSFGSVVAGTGAKSVALTSASAGLFRVNGKNNRVVNVTLSPPANLSNGTNTIPYTWQAAFNNTAATASAATVTTTQNFQVQLKEASPGNTSNAYIWIYGSINLGTAPSTLPGGAYTGNFVVTVAY